MRFDTEEERKAAIATVEEIIERDRKIIENGVKGPIVYPETLITYKGEPLINKCTVNLIQGQTGVHKSRASNGLVSIVIGKNPENKKYLGFETKSSDPMHALCIDTEMNQQYQLPLVLKKTIRRSGWDPKEDVPYFSYRSLLNVARPLRPLGLERILSGVRASIPIDQHVVAFIDVATDAVSDFNDLKETNTLIDQLNMYCAQFNMTFILVIHENPDNLGKARGHLGTELTNKASAVIRIKRATTGVFEIVARKIREGDTPSPSYVEYNPLVEDLVLVEQFEPKGNENQQKVIEYLTGEKNLKFKMKEIEKQTQIKDQTLKRTVQKIEEDGIQIEREGVFYTLAMEKEGRDNIAQLFKVYDQEELAAD